ncbi:6688_t:CDS:2, partial [Funneliformis mosseae]
MTTKNGVFLCQNEMLDTGAKIITIPFFLRQRLQSSREGWRSEYDIANGYEGGLRIYQVSRSWLVCLSDKINWSNWIRTRSIYSWPKNTLSVNCDLVGHEILDNIPHFKSVRNPYIFLRDNSVFDRLQGLSN